MSTTPVANGTLNTRSKSQVKVSYQPTQLYFRPEKCEFIIVPLEDAASFEQHGIGMIKAMDDLHRANLAISDAVTQYAKARDSGDPALVSTAKRRYDNAYKHQRKVAKALRVWLSDVDALSSDAPNGGGIVELIPMRGEPAAAISSPKSGYGKRLFYVNAKKIKHAWRTVGSDNTPSGKQAQEAIKTKPRFEKPGGIPSLVVRPKDVAAKIDLETLGKLIKEVKPELKSAWDKKHEDALFDWAKKMNEALIHQQEGIDGKYTHNIDLSSQAQVMRYAVGKGAEASLNVRSGKLGIKAEAKLEFALAESKGTMTLYGPHRLGWMLKIEDKRGNSYPLGALRAQLEIVVSGVVGASLIAELGCEIQILTNKVAAKGIPAEDTKPPPVDPNDSKAVTTSVAKDQPVKGELALFEGAKASLDLTGSLQWLNPEKIDGKENEFKDFLKVSPGASGTAGLGAGAKFEVGYSKGVFTLILEASICLGLGARGKIGCESDAKLIGEFLIWFHTQLRNSNYHHLEFVSAEAFRAASAIQFLAIQTGQKAEQFALKTENQLTIAIDEVLVALEKSKHRNVLADHVLSSPPLLRHSTPETKGALLYHLTRHSTADWLDTGNFILGDAYGTRKKAVLEILRWVQTRREWEKVMMRVDARGIPTKENARGHLQRFLKLGYNDMDGDLDLIEERLHREPARGHAVAANDTAEYRLHDFDHPAFAVASIVPLTLMDSNANA